MWFEKVTVKTVQLFYLTVLCTY